MSVYVIRCEVVLLIYQVHELFTTTGRQLAGVRLARLAHGTMIIALASLLYIKHLHSLKCEYSSMKGRTEAINTIIHIPPNIHGES